MPRLRINTIPVQAQAMDAEADLLAEVRSQGLRLKYDSSARKAGLPHIEIRRREGRVIGSFRTAAEALQWLEARQ